MERPPLPLYRPSAPVSKLRSNNVQHRHLLYLASSRTPSSATQAEASPAPDPSVDDVLVPMVHHHHHHGKRSSSGLGNSSTWYWGAGAVLLCWILFVTLLLISHLTAPALPSARNSEPKRETLEFALIPTQGRFLNVSLPKSMLRPDTAAAGWHRTCCWQRHTDQHHCDGSGMFAVHVERATSALVVRVIQTDIIGAQCTFHYYP